MSTLKNTMVFIITFCVIASALVLVFNDMSDFYNPNVTSNYTNFYNNTSHILDSSYLMSNSSRADIENTTVLEDDFEGSLIASSWAAVKNLFNMIPTTIHLIQAAWLIIGVESVWVSALITLFIFVISFAFISWVFRRND